MLSEVSSATHAVKPFIDKPIKKIKGYHSSWIISQERFVSLRFPVGQFYIRAGSFYF